MSKVEVSPDEFLRHMCAHAGFEYTTAEGFVVNSCGKIVKVIYNEKLLYTLLKRVKGLEITCD